MGRGGGGEEEVGSYGDMMHESHHILYTRHIVTTSSTELYSFMKIILMVFKIESIAASRENKVCKQELSLLYAAYHHDCSTDQ